MNERIKEIAEHCDFSVGNEHYDKSHEEKQRLFMERFAELIVFKCIALCNETYFENYPDAEHWEESEAACVIREYFLGED